MSRVRIPPDDEHFFSHISGASLIQVFNGGATNLFFQKNLTVQLEYNKTKYAGI